MAENVAELCERHKVSVEELANRTGVPVDRVTAIALGRWTPSPDERNKIAGAFGLQPGDIGWGHKTPIQHIYGHGPA